MWRNGITYYRLTIDDSCENEASFVLEFGWRRDWQSDDNHKAKSMQRHITSKETANEVAYAMLRKT